MNTPRPPPWKARQNRNETDRRGVEAGLRSEGHLELAALVRARGA